MTSLPAPDAAVRIAAFLDDHLSWSAWWQMPAVSRWVESPAQP